VPRKSPPNSSIHGGGGEQVENWPGGRGGTPPGIVLLSIIGLQAGGDCSGTIVTVRKGAAKNPLDSGRMDQLKKGGHFFTQSKAKRF